MRFWPSFQATSRLFLLGAVHRDKSRPHQDRPGWVLEEGVTPMLDPLAEQILQELKRRPGQKAAELAQAADADRRDVNR